MEKVICIFFSMERAAQADVSRTWFEQSLNLEI